jgi:hypothetical protein
MRIVVTRKELKQIRAAVTIKCLNLDFESVTAAMIQLQCRSCRKDHIAVKVKTMWHKR